MPRPEPQDAEERRFLDIIDRSGWHVTQVGADEEGPGFAYSTGIYEPTGEPEVVVVGRLDEVAGWVVNQYGSRIAAAERFKPGRFYQGFLEGHRVTFLEATHPQALLDCATWTDWYYRRDGFPLLQLVCPGSRTGSFPWQSGYGEAWIARQPLLGPVPQLLS